MQPNTCLETFAIPDWTGIQGKTQTIAVQDTQQTRVVLSLSAHEEQNCSLHGNSLSGLWKPNIVPLFLLTPFLVPEWRFSIFLGNSPTFTDVSRSHYIMFWDLTSTLNFLVGKGEETTLFHPRVFSGPYFDTAHLYIPPILTTYITHKKCYRLRFKFFFILIHSRNLGIHVLCLTHALIFIQSFFHNKASRVSFLLSCCLFQGKHLKHL